jgi:CRP/FNR family cyclic AMP-dependent transcriptional regulator
MTLLKLRQAAIVNWLCGQRSSNFMTPRPRRRHRASFRPLACGNFSASPAGFQSFPVTRFTMFSAKEGQDFLETIPIFAGLNRSALAVIAKAVEQSSFHAGDTILGEEETGNRMFIIQAGRVEVVKHLGEERETVLAVLGPKEFFGEMCIIECLTRCASVRAIEKTRVFALKSTDLHRLFEKQPDQYAIMILNIARDISRRLRALDELFAAVSH